MSAPNKTKTKGRKGKSLDGIPSNLEAQASSPAAPPTSAAPRTPTTPQPPSLPAAAAAPSQLTKDKDQMPTPQRAGPVQQRTGTPRPQQPKSKTKTAVQQQQQQPQSPATPKETIRPQQKAVSTPQQQQQQQALKDQTPAAQHQIQSIPSAQHKASPRPNQVSHKAAGGVAQETEIAKLKAALKEEQGKSQSMGMVVKYLENAKDTLEREKQALLQNKSSEVDELTTKLTEAKSKAKDFEEKLRLREKQALEEKQGEVKRLEDSIRNVRVSAQKAVGEKEEMLKNMQQKLQAALDQLKHKRSEADIAKIKELEEQCLKLQESKKESSKVNVKKYELKLKTKEEEVAALENRIKESAITNESSMKALADRLEQTQAQVSTLMSTITTKEAAYKTKEDGLVKKQEDKMKVAQEKISTLQAALQTKDEEKGKKKNYEEKIKKLEENLKTTKEKSDKSKTDLEGKLKEFNAQVKQEKAKTCKLEKSVKDLEESNAKLEERATAAEAEKQKLKEEKVNKAKAAKKEQIELKAAVEARAISEKQLKASEVRVKELETQVKAAVVENEESKLKLGELELDCGEAVSKYKDLQERKSEADMKYLEAEREVGEIKKTLEEHREKYEYAVSNKTRYEYQINFLEEKVRRLTKSQGSSSETQVPLKTTTPNPVSTPPNNNTSNQDVNEQFLSLLDTDTAAKFKELEETCHTMKEQQSKLEEKLKEEFEKNLALVKNSEQIEAKLVKMEDLEKENILLQEKLDIAAKDDMSLFVMEDAPVIVSDKELGDVEMSKEENPPAENAKLDDKLDTLKGAKAQKEEKSVQTVEEEKGLLEKKNAELTLMRENLSQLTSTSAEKEAQLSAEIETLKAKLVGKYSFLECGVKVKKVAVGDSNNVVKVQVQDLADPMIDQASPKDTDDSDDGDLNSKDEVKENLLLKAEIDKLKNEMKTMSKAFGNSKEEGESEQEKAESEAQEMKWKGVLAEAELKVESLSKEKEEKERKIREQNEALKKVLENEVELKQTITLVSRVKESAHQEKEMLRKELAELKESVLPKTNAEVLLLRAELDKLRKEKNLLPADVKEEPAIQKKEEVLQGEKRKRSESGGESKKSKLEKVEDSEEKPKETNKKIVGDEENTEGPGQSGTTSGVNAGTQDLNACESEAENRTYSRSPTNFSVTQLEREKAALELELRLREGGSSLPEEALLASPQPVSKPVNILFCNWAEPELKVQSESTKSDDISSDNTASTLEDAAP